MTFLRDRREENSLSRFKENADVALWFAESYGLVPTVLQLETSTCHRPVQIELHGEAPIILNTAAADEKLNKLLQVNRTSRSQT